MGDFRTRMMCVGTGKIIQKNELLDFNGVKNITLLVSFARRRQEASSGNQITEEDVVPIKFWSTGADIIHDAASVGDYIFVEAEIRQRGTKLEIKAKHFDILGEKHE